jgi:hypothetical protein
VALLVAAVAAVAGSRETIGEALDAVRHPSPGPVALLIGAVVSNVVLTALMFSVLMTRYGKVGVGEMLALIAAASLLNFLPLRPGLFGRIAYHKVYNAIPPTATLKTVVQAAVISVSVAAYLAVALTAAGTPAISLGLAVALPLPLLAGAAAPRAVRVWAAAGLIRYLEVLVWAVRYHAAFALLGTPIDASSALAFACLGVLANLVPFVGNGLGVREWAVGLAAPLLTPYMLQRGLAAELVNRAAELMLVTGIGLVGVSWLVKRGRIYFSSVDNTRGHHVREK